ncbi:tRNA uracil 4-sulfurtransferase ThiI [Caldalkalibacillus salinus]|uniref:tRNA uracil 4-sulfurtransferase ThiI n=1 Tax=Caldalkalibacillus salinus TaxID=2803787 RepID=UPI0019235AA8|nr:tRNA uracil 4-sulfurtransferase ThiI [Caldalkalibacillus salinus]
MTQTQVEFILIRYGELALKGKNRKKFEDQLAQNIRTTMSGLNIQVKRVFGRMYVYLNGEDYHKVASKLQKVFGIKSFSPALKSELDVEKIKETALYAIQRLPQKPHTFKVNTRRPNKSFPYASAEMNRHIGAHILVNTEDIKVDVHDPDVEVLVEIREDAAYIMSEKVEGSGGLPVGTSGKAMLMLSGGIDSPVAGYLCMKRGLRVEGVHFHSYPFTSERAKQKVVDLSQKLTQFVGQVKLHVVPFTEIQTEIKKHVPEEYSITIMRRIMVRITEKLAELNRAKALATGDNVGQVASQTIESMHTINEVTNYPILRPLVTMDKLEIIDIAKSIDTYDISILPYEDCCTVFQPKNPKTKPTRKQANRFEERLDLAQLIDNAVEKTEVLRLTPETQGETKEEEHHKAINDLF